MTGWSGHPGGRPDHPAGGGIDAVAGAAAVAAVAVGGWVWASGQIAGWLARGRWPAVRLSAVAAIVAGLPAHLDDPRAAWPAAARPVLPGPALLYACAGVLLGIAGAAVRAGWRHRRRARPGPASPACRMGSRPKPAGGLHWTGGARWASRRDLRELRVRPGGRGGRLGLGRVCGPPGGRSLLATEARHSVLVVGPTQSGKTTGLAVPALLEWRGPIIATSVKDDLAAASLAWRSRHGPCWVFDPTRSSGLRPLASWSPLAACPDWSGAQRLAGWMVEATPARTGTADAAFWYAAAAKQLAPLLLAAERGGMTMAEVVRWTNAGWFDEPIRLLEVAGEGEAVVALTACASREPRILSSVATTLETVLAPFEDPVVAASTAAAEIDLRALLSRGGSLYLCGPSHEQHRVQGLFAALVSAAVAAAIQHVNDSSLPLDPPLLLVLDEAANIAPVRDLDTLASTGAGLGVQLVTVCQDLAQLTNRYGADRARTIANNHRAKVLLSGVSDLTTLDLVSGLAGEAAVREDTVTHDLRDGRRTRSSAVVFRRLAPTDELRRIPPGEGVLVYGHLPPVRLRLRPWFRDRRLRGRARAEAAGDAAEANP
jgi:type IV secretion system protein VirD4